MQGERAQPPKERRHGVAIEPDGAQNHEIAMALGGDLLGIEEICPDRPHGFAEDRKDLEYSRLLEIAKNRLPIPDNLLVPVRRIKEWPKNVFVTLRHDSRDKSDRG